MFHPRALVLLVAVSALAGQARELDTAAEATTPLPGCATADDCASGFVCSGYRSQWLRGVCEPLRRCGADNQCEPGFICSDFRSLGEGKWLKGYCQTGRAGSTCTRASDCARGFHCPGPNGICLVSEPTPAPKTTADEPDRFRFDGTVPEGFHLVTGPRRGAAKWSLVGAGIGAFGAGYLVSAGIALGTRHYGGLVPVVGTVVLIFSGLFPGSSGDFLHIAQIAAVFGCVVDVAAQVTGLVLLMVGLFAPSRWLERDAAKPRVTLIAGAAGAPLGASLVGRF